MKIGIGISGADEILETLENLVDTSQYERAVQEACALVERTAKQKAPKGSGELRRSIASKVDKSGNDIEGIVFTPLEYAPYVEFGTGLFAENGGRMDVPWNYQDDEGNWHSTSGMKPQPFLRPALEENREKILRLLKGGIGE